MFSEKYHYFIYVLSGMYSMTICGKSGIKDDSVSRRVSVTER